MLVVVVLLGCMCVVVAAAIVLVLMNSKGTAPSPQFGRVPAWAEEVVRVEMQVPKGRMAERNASGKQLDFVLYGDSITYYLRQNTFAKHFGKWNSVALGVPGNTIENLAWRITSGNERPAKSPRVIALLIGINNDPLTFPASVGHLSELIQWLQRAYPPTKIILLGLLPHAVGRGRNTHPDPNRVYRELARLRGIDYAECGQDINPNDKTQMWDGLHPTDAGYDKFLQCLAQSVGRHLGA